MINTQGRASRLSSSGVPVRRTTACPRRPQLAAIQPPLQKDDSNLAPRVSALELSPWACRLTLWGTLDARAEPTWPRPGLFVDRTMYPCWPALLRRPLAVRSRLGPNVDGVAGRIQRSELLPSRDALRA